MSKKGGMDVKDCRLTITTTVDGVENSITREGKMEISLSQVLLSYREENAFVRMQLQGDSAKIERQGDYSLRLHLKENEKSVGEIGIGSSCGEIQTFAYKVVYSVSKDSLLLSLRYDLIISGEKQEMKLRLLSRFRGE